MNIKVGLFLTTFGLVTQADQEIDVDDAVGDGLTDDNEKFEGDPTGGRSVKAEKIAETKTESAEEEEAMKAAVQIMALKIYG